MKEDILLKARAQGIIISGDAKKSLETALRAASGMVCIDSAGVKPCGKCPACIQSAAGTNPDIIIVRSEKASLGIEAVKTAVSDTIKMRPMLGNRKVYIIPNAQKMTSEAQNQLLKTLEEPPEYAVIMLVTDSEYALLETIRSRCVKYIENTAVSPEDYDDSYFVYIDAIKNKKENVIIEGQKASESGIRFVEFARMFFRDVLILKKTGNMDSLFFIKEKEYIKEISNKITFEKAGKILNALDEAEDALKANVNAGSVLKMMLEEF